MSHFKHMDQAQLAKLQSLEKQFGPDKRIIAFENGPRFAEVSAQDLETLKSAEKELGATLVVYGVK